MRGLRAWWLSLLNDSQAYQDIKLTSTITKNCSMELLVWSLCDLNDDDHEAWRGCQSMIAG